MALQKIFINLTSGIEAIEKYNLPKDSVSFIRIQSSHCESHKWELILDQLDNNFLMFAALGYECIVYDFGAHTQDSKAIYIGLEWIKFYLNLRWLSKDYHPIVKNKDLFDQFIDVSKKINKKSRWRIDYFKHFLATDEIRIKGISRQTEHDNDYQYFRQILERYYRV